MNAIGIETFCVGERTEAETHMPKEQLKTFVIDPSHFAVGECLVSFPDYEASFIENKIYCFFVYFGVCVCTEPQ